MKQTILASSPGEAYPETAKVWGVWIKKTGAAARISAVSTKFFDNTNTEIARGFVTRLLCPLFASAFVTESNYSSDATQADS